MYFAICSRPSAVFPFHYRRWKEGDMSGFGATFLFFKVGYVLFGEKICVEFFVECGVVTA